MTKGLKIGPLDKNNGELWYCCPTLYNQALEKYYSEDNGYEEVFVKKFTNYRKKQFPIEKELREKILGTTAAPLQQRGTEKDLIALWKWQYKQRKWNTFAGFKQTGGLNYPYILFKAKK